MDIESLQKLSANLMEHKELLPDAFYKEHYEMLLEIKNKNGNQTKELVEVCYVMTTLHTFPFRMPFTTPWCETKVLESSVKHTAIMEVVHGGLNMEPSEIFGKNKVLAGCVNPGDQFGTHWAYEDIHNVEDMEYDHREGFVVGKRTIYTIISKKEYKAK